MTTKLTLTKRVDLLAEMVAILIEQQAVSAFALRDAGDKMLQKFNEACDRRLRNKPKPSRRTGGKRKGKGK